MPITNEHTTTETTDTGKRRGSAEIRRQLASFTRAQTTA